MPDFILIEQYPEEGTRTRERPCYWVAEATVDGRVFRARSRYGASCGVARQLVAAGVLDGPVRVHDRGHVGHLNVRSLHYWATRAYSGEGEQRRYTEPDFAALKEGGFEAAGDP